MWVQARQVQPWVLWLYGFMADDDDWWRISYDDKSRRCFYVGWWWRLTTWWSPWQEYFPLGSPHHRLPLPHVFPPSYRAKSRKPKREKPPASWSPHKHIQQTNRRSTSPAACTAEPDVGHNARSNRRRRLSPRYATFPLLDPSPLHVSIYAHCTAESESPEYIIDILQTVANRHNVQSKRWNSVAHPGPNRK